MNHIILAREQLWEPSPKLAAPPLISTFQRLYQSPPPLVSSRTQIQYFEADIAGSVFLPQGVKFVIGRYSDLFGTPDGILLQQWCVKNGWSLLWAPGFNCDAIANATVCANATHHDLNENTLTSGVHRLVDPIVQLNNSHSRRLNISTSEGTAEVFSKHWDEVAKSISGNRSLVPSSVMSQAWRKSWQVLVTGLPSTFGVRALAAYRCGDSDRCVGTVLGGTHDCVCYNS
jgi:hypothetical protein